MRRKGSVSSGFGLLILLLMVLLKMLHVLVYSVAAVANAPHIENAGIAAANVSDIEKILVLLLL